MKSGSTPCTELTLINEDTMDYEVNLRVIGMMCQKNCGTTVRQALEEVPGCISAQATFATSYASVNVNLKIYAGIKYGTTKQDEETSFVFDSSDHQLIEELRHKLELEVAETVEDVGFDVTILQPGDVLELFEEGKNAEKTNILSNSLDHFGDSNTADDDGLNNNNIVVSDDSGILGGATFEVCGMSCAVCTGRVEKTLKEVPGVEYAAVSLPTNRARVKFIERTTCHASNDMDNESQLSPDEYASRLAEKCSVAVKLAGYGCEVLEIYLPSGERHGGLTLAESAKRLEIVRAKELQEWSHLFKTACLFTIPILLFHYLGSSHLWKYWISLFLSTPVQFHVGKRFYIAAYHSFSNGRVMGMDFLVVLGTSAAYLYSVIVLGVLSFAVSTGSEYDLKPTFETGAMLVTFVTFGKYLEAYAKGKTASALQKLMELQPLVATRCNMPPSSILKDDGIERFTEGVNLNAIEKQDVNVKDVKVGDYLLVVPGSRIPTDGVVVHHEGTGDACYVEESALSGEPFPVAKSIGDKIFGSTLNQLSVIVMRVEATGTETVLARIVKLIEEAQVSRAPIQAMADYVASVFAPCVMILSAITFIGWMSFNDDVDDQQRLFVALMSAISVIVVACPCALGLATPTAVMVGTGVGATNGLLIKGGAVLEEAHCIDTIIFDKTGTITSGRAIVGERIDFFDDIKKKDPLLQNLPRKVEKGNLTLWLAACAEMNSEHPLATAIINEAKGIFGGDFTCSSENVSVSDSSVTPGSGVEARVSHKSWGKWIVRVGKSSYVNEAVHDRTSESPMRERVGEREIESLRERGQIGVYVSVMPANTRSKESRRVIGILGIVDSIEPNAKSTVKALQTLGIDVWMCTGDHDSTARAVAQEVGIPEENVCANVNPEGKADLVTRLQRRRMKKKKSVWEKEERQGGSVAMVGDGINDSIALARANVGIAIGAGTEVAVEAADIVLVRSNLHDVFIALHLSRVVFSRIQMNFIWALGYNVFALPFAAGILYPLTDWRLPPAFAGLMMAFSSVSVVTNSLLLRFYSKPTIDEDGNIELTRFARFCYNGLPSKLKKRGQWEKVHSSVVV